MEAIKSLLQANQGNKSTLNRAYNKHIYNILTTLSEENEERWENYTAIIYSILNDTKMDHTDEMKYRITDGENPNNIILDIIERQGLDVDGLVWFLKRRIEGYIEEDFLKRFYV